MPPELSAEVSGKGGGGRGGGGKENGGKGGGGKGSDGRGEKREKGASTSPPPPPPPYLITCTQVGTVGARSRTGVHPSRWSMAQPLGTPDANGGEVVWGSNCYRPSSQGLDAWAMWVPPTYRVSLGRAGQPVARSSDQYGPSLHLPHIAHLACCLRTDFPTDRFLSCAEVSAPGLRGRRRYTSIQRADVGTTRQRPALVVWKHPLRRGPASTTTKPKTHQLIPHSLGRQLAGARSAHTQSPGGQLTRELDQPPI